MCIDPQNELLQQCIASDQVSASQLVQHANEGDLTMEAVDLKELKRKAEAAIARSEAIGEESWYESHELQAAMGINAADSGFIAAASPKAVSSLIAEVESLRKQLEEKDAHLNQELDKCARFRDDILALRSSIDADIERAIRLALAYKDPNWRDADIAAVLAQFKEQKKP